MLEVRMVLRKDYEKKFFGEFLVKSGKMAEAEKEKEEEFANKMSERLTKFRAANPDMTAGMSNPTDQAESPSPLPPIPPVSPIAPLTEPPVQPPVSNANVAEGAAHFDLPGDDRAPYPGSEEEAQEPATYDPRGNPIL